MDFPCQLLSLIFVEENKKKGQRWCLEILTSLDKEDFIKELQAALWTMVAEEDYGGRYWVEMSRTDFPSRDFYDGYVEANTTSPFLDTSTYKHVHKFAYVKSDQLLPIEKLLKSNMPDTVVINQDSIVKLLRQKNVLYEKFADV